MLAVHRSRVGHFDGGLARQVGPDDSVLDKSPRFVNALRPMADGFGLAQPAGYMPATMDGRFTNQPRLPSDHINGLALGLDVTVWVATSRGVRN